MIYYSDKECTCSILCNCSSGHVQVSCPSHGFYSHFNCVRQVTNMTGVVEHLAPAKPKYSSRASRLRSFPDGDLNVLAEELADAGFFYTDDDDDDYEARRSGNEKVDITCFQCNVHLSISDLHSPFNPWAAHARHSKMCEYVRVKCGDEYILKQFSETQGNGCPRVSDALDMECKICATRPARHRLLLPCAHNCCDDCMFMIGLQCPVCRGKIFGSVAMFLQ